MRHLQVRGCMKKPSLVASIDREKLPESRSEQIFYTQPLKRAFSICEKLEV